MTAAAKVGIFMILILAIVGFFILRIEDISLGDAGRTRTVDVIFESAAGLNKKTDVRVAGVPVGKVTDIQLDEQGRARVTLEISDDVRLREGAHATIANLGLLGEKYVELDPGNPAAPAVPLSAGQTLVLRGRQTASIDQVTDQVSAIAADVKAITASLRNAMAGPAGEQRVEEIVTNVHDITDRVRLILEVNQGNINATAANFRKITDDLRVEIPRIAASIERFADSMGGTVGENRADVRAVVQNLRELSADLRVTATNLNSITGKVESGEGTVGKLIYSDEAHTRLTNALASVESGVTELKNTIGRVGRIELDLGIKADYYAGIDDDESLPFSGNGRSGVALKLNPNPERNRFYNVELNDDPKGSRKDKVVRTTLIDANGNASVTEERQTKFERDFLISAQAGWQLDELALRLGLFDSTGGIGADYDLSRRLRVTGEAFDFGEKRDDNPHLRLYGRYLLSSERPNFPALFISTGIDNPLNDTAFTFGGGVQWRDDDLKYLLGSIPSGF